MAPRLRLMCHFLHVYFVVCCTCYSGGCSRRHVRSCWRGRSVRSCVVEAALDAGAAGVIEALEVAAAPGATIAVTAGAVASAGAAGRLVPSSVLLLSGAASVWGLHSASASCCKRVSKSILEMTDVGLQLEAPKIGWMKTVG
ncbi:hypothetical protein PR003_g24281 [Phytophthora rubi]|uniref:Secreted protein n=1 Tax=Phytophthora rubi TaxID=129364 RepID=A0A6A4CPD0_9STRA|nr:hypothetical protein PR002_g23579 [Phytophthora rubi]KAE8984086.1 hypothetical protein PR001_g23272 [Phytophthora rubi]KAE9294352.1 hypothetical protein PR003_g24281 [Phytophthora rubi]